jgi:hypothetical protein
MTTTSSTRLFGIPVLLLVTLGASGLPAAGIAQEDADGDVVAGFDLSAPDTGPFPSDIFTVADPRHNTGRRVAYPYPDCSERPSDCNDIAVINTLDGWGLQAQISIPFSAAIDPASVTSDTVFVVSLGSTRPGDPPGGQRIGINQVVWDVETRTLLFEVDRLLEQHRRYGVIVTKQVRDMLGKKVKATPAFQNYDTTAPAWYAASIHAAVAAAHALGVPPGQVVTASVFTTQTITSVMERIRDDLKATIPEPADFLLGPAGERTVFNRADVTSVTLRPQTVVSPPAFTNDMAINLAQLDAVPGAVGTIAYGRYVSPDYLVHPGEYIPEVGTLAETPPVRGYNQVYFTLYLPSGPKPSGGWPIVIAMGGASGNQHVSPTIFASKMASHGLATIGISQVGQGFGPFSRLQIARVGLPVLDIPDAGRGADQNGDNAYSAFEGSEAAAPRTWTISLRDTYRQTVIDLMQLVRVIEIGMDVNGDFLADLDPTRIYYQGTSAGTMMGTSFTALDTSVTAASFTVPPGLIPEHVRWQPVRRAAMGAMLAARVPSLINADGRMSIDGVAVAGPHFNENKPLRNQPMVINTIPGAVAIQRALEFAEMAAEAGIGPVPWAKYLRARPLAGSYPKSILIQFARGDQNAVDPGTTALVREGDLADIATFYRHDLAWLANPSIAKNPHLFVGQPTSANATVRAISLGAQEQIAVFYESVGQIIAHPSPAQFFETPIAGPLPETLDFIR